MAVSRRKSRLPPYLILSTAIIVLAAAAGGIAAFLHPTLPRRIVMATGANGGAYAEAGAQYRRLFAQQGVTLTLRHSPGSIENLAMLRYRDTGVGIALVQSGLTDPQRSPGLVSLGTMSLEPLWIFYRLGHGARLGRLEQLRGRRVSIEPFGSGMRSLTLELLAKRGIDQRDSALLSLPAQEAGAALLAGQIDVAMIVASPEAPVVRRLIASPKIGLLPLRHADAYVALYPYLTKVVLPAGFADPARGRPASDVAMVAVRTGLVVRRDLPAAVQYLLLEASSEIYAGPGVFHKAGRFPAAEATDLPLSENARQFYKSGPPLLQRHLPLWLAILIEQLAIALLPVAAVAYPLLRTVPAIYDWAMRRRVCRLYGELKMLELTREDRGAERRSDCLPSC